jgi:hypothetical protein
MKNARSSATTHLELAAFANFFFNISARLQRNESADVARRRMTSYQLQHTYPQDALSFSNGPSCGAAECRARRQRVPIAAPGATQPTLKMRMRAGASRAKEKRGPRSWSDGPRETRSHTRALTRFQRGARCPSFWLAGNTTQRLRRGARSSVDGRSPGRVNRSNPGSGSSRKAAEPAICLRQMKKRENGSPFDDGEADYCSSSSIRRGTAHDWNAGRTISAYLSLG